MKFFLVKTGKSVSDNNALRLRIENIAIDESHLCKQKLLDEYRIKQFFLYITANNGQTYSEFQTKQQGD